MHTKEEREVLKAEALRLKKEHGWGCRRVSDNIGVSVHTIRYWFYPDSCKRRYDKYVTKIGRELVRTRHRADAARSLQRQVASSIHSASWQAKKHGHMPCTTPEQAILAAWTGRCHVCNKSCGGFGSGSKLHMDHDRKRGPFRGWLCGNCNHAIGNADDDPARLRALAAYLEDPPGLKVKLIQPMLFPELEQ